MVSVVFSDSAPSALAELKKSYFRESQMGPVPLCKKTDTCLLR